MASLPSEECIERGVHGPGRYQTKDHQTQLKPGGRFGGGNEAFNLK